MFRFNISEIVFLLLSKDIGIGFSLEEVFLLGAQFMSDKY